MLIELREPHPHGYSFVVYEPPVDNLPWLAVCVGPGRRIIEAESFRTKAEADAAIEKLASDFHVAMQAYEATTH